MSGDEPLAGTAEIRADLSKVNPGSPREAELLRALEDKYRVHHGEPRSPETPAARPDGGPVVLLPPTPDGFAPATALLAETNVRSERLNQINEQLGWVLLPTAQRAAFEQERDQILKEDAEALASYAPEPTPTPTTLEWPDGVEDSVKAGWCALALEHNIPTPEAQAAVRELTNITPMSADPDAARPLLRREFGDALPSVLAHAEQIFDELPPRLQRLIQEPEIFFSPPVLRHLNLLWERSRRGGR